MDRTDWFLLPLALRQRWERETDHGSKPPSDALEQAVKDALALVDMRAEPIGIHEARCVAMKELEIVIGTDRIVRINVDGICALRARAAPGAIIVINDMNRREDRSC